MDYLYQIPSSFWGLFRSVNRDIYIEALLTIQEEYQYNHYFLSKESTQQVLAEMCAHSTFRFEKEEEETLEEVQESLGKRILRWLLKAGWLRKVDDFSTMSTNIVIPDYSALFLETFEKLVYDPYDEAEIYIQNVYATLFSFQHDTKQNLTLLKTALVNTRKLNKALQDMLHNMDSFFDRLLEKKTYGELLKEHLNGYVEEVVKQKYHLLKTSDNFYIYKMDIKTCLKQMQENEEWIEKIRQKEKEKNKDLHPKNKQVQNIPYFLSKRKTEEDVLELIEQIERGFEDIERRISNMDKEHSKYIRATVSRLQYLLNEEDDRRGLMVTLLNQLGGQLDYSQQKERIKQVGNQINLVFVDLLGDTPFYRPRKKRDFTEVIVSIEQEKELTKEEVLSLNKIRHRYSKLAIEEFIEKHLKDQSFDTETFVIESKEDFELLILAYNQCTEKNSGYKVLILGKTIQQGNYSFPAMSFIKKGTVV